MNACESIGVGYSNYSIIFNLVGVADQHRSIICNTGKRKNWIAWDEQRNFVESSMDRNLPTKKKIMLENWLPLGKLRILKLRVNIDVETMKYTILVRTSPLWLLQLAGRIFTILWSMDGHLNRCAQHTEWARYSRSLFRTNAIKLCIRRLMRPNCWPLLPFYLSANKCIENSNSVSDELKQLIAFKLISPSYENAFAAS